LTAFKSELLQDIGERWDNLSPILKLATYFDPRFKHLSWASKSNIAEVKLIAKEKFEKEITLRKEQSTSNEMPFEEEKEDLEPPAKKAKSCLNELSAFLEEGQKLNQNIHPALTDLKQQFGIYDNLPILKMKGNPLQWWFEKSAQLPILCLLAKHILLFLLLLFLLNACFLTWVM